MEIKCTPQELKELLKKETPATGTTDVYLEGELLQTLQETPKMICNNLPPKN